MWKLDRLGRSVKDVLIIADDLHEKGIGIRILTGRLSGVYSPTGEGKFFFTMMAAFAELERDIIRERTIASVQAARAKGKQLGRPPAMTPEMVEDARHLLTAPNATVSAVAKRLAVSRATIYEYVPELLAGAGHRDPLRSISRPGEHGPMTSPDLPSPPDDGPVPDWVLQRGRELLDPHREVLEPLLRAAADVLDADQ